MKGRRLVFGTVGESRSRFRIIFRSKILTSNRNKSNSSKKQIQFVQDNSDSEDEYLDPVMQAMREVDLNLEHQITPSFYYYKRWLWISFPWICLHADQRFNFSSLITECYSSNIKYLSVKDDMMLTVRNP